MYLFDMDGTLIDSNDVWKDVDREFLARRGLPYTKAYYEGVAHTIFPLAAKFTKEFCNLPDSEEAIMAEWMELAKDAYAHVTVKPGVRAFLKQCKAENRRMAAGDLQRAGALPHRDGKAGSDEVLRVRHLCPGVGY